METDKHYFIVGLFIIMIALGGLGFTLWLTSAGKGETADYRIRFAESVSGLKVGNTVRFRGVDVGNVRKITINPKDINMIEVDIRILRSTPVKTDTLASLKLQDISGDLYVELTGNNTNAPELLTAAQGDDLPEIRADKSSFNSIMNHVPQLLEKTTQLLEKANHIASQVDKVFSDHNIAVVNAAIVKLAGYVGVKDAKTGKQQ